MVHWVNRWRRWAGELTERMVGMMAPVTEGGGPGAAARIIGAFLARTKTSIKL